MYSNRCYVLQIQQNYTFEILRPLQTAILAQGGKVLWFVVGNDVDETRFTPFEEHTHNVDLVKAFSPDAVFVTGNVVPDFIPGLKVQVFHGFEWKKRGILGSVVPLICIAPKVLFLPASLQSSHRKTVIISMWSKRVGLKWTIFFHCTQI